MERLLDERSSARLTDEDLEHYGDLYVQSGLRAAGVPFEKYLENPEYFLLKHAREILRGRRTTDEGPGWLSRLFRSRMPDPASAD